MKIQLALPDTQMQRSNMSTDPKPINVASVRQLSPFRYPGGKTWLVPYVRNWVHSLGFRPTAFVEPFAGGGILSLTAAYENWADRAVMVEIDPDVASVWKQIVGGNAKCFADKILAFGMTSENVDCLLTLSNPSDKQRAFQTLVRNRINHGGILAKGSSRLKYGEDGKGILSRWYPETLASRVRIIGQISPRLDFIEGDGFAVIEEHLSSPNVCFLLDPPYTFAGKRAGRRLYTHWDVDHGRLFDLMAKMGSPFLATYDESDEIISMARARGFDVILVPMQNTHLARKWELLISSNLEWLRTSALNHRDC